MGDERGPNEGQAEKPDPLKELTDGLISGDPSAAKFFRGVFAGSRVDLFVAFEDRGKGYKQRLEEQRILQAAQLFRLKLGIQDHMTLREVLRVFEEGMEEGPDTGNKALIGKIIRRAYKKMELHPPEIFAMTEKGVYSLILNKVITLPEVEQLIIIGEILDISFDHLLKTRDLKNPIKSLSEFSQRLRKGTFNAELDFGIRKLQEIKPDIDASLVRGDFFEHLPKLLQAVSVDEAVQFDVTDMTGLSFLIQEALSRIPGLVHKIPKDNAEETLSSGITYHEFLSVSYLVLQAIQPRVDRYLLQT